MTRFNYKKQKYICMMMQHSNKSKEEFSMVKWLTYLTVTF